MNTRQMLGKVLIPRSADVADRMTDVLIALIPAAAAGCVYFGYNAVLLLFVCPAAAAATEWLLSRLLRIPCQTRDLSAVVTGLLVALGQSPHMPVWAAALCTVLSVAVGRMFFGGSGCEIVSPAALGIVLSRLSFPTHSSTFSEAFSHTETMFFPLNSSDGVYTLKQLLFGAHSGAIGEVGSLFLLMGALYLLVRRVISITVPAAMTIGATVAALICSADLAVTLLGGGLLLGAVFIATDYTLLPRNVSGQLAYGAVCGILTVLIRRFGGADEGVYFAILLINLLHPLFSAIPDFNFLLPTKGELRNET